MGPLVSVRQMLSLIRFIHTVFALPFALFAAVMAWVANAHARPPWPWRWQELAGIMVCMVGARSAAMAINRIADRRWDAQNPRTATRHLPAGLVRLATVVWFSIASCLLFLFGTALFLPNHLPLYLALPVLIFLVGYSYSKRFTAWTHFYLGAALGLAPVASWIAIRGQQVVRAPSDLLPAVVLGAAVMSWVAGFDLIYACQDAAFDRRVGLSSIPARWGIARALRLAALCHLGTIVLLALLPLSFPTLGWIYVSGIVAVALLLIYEHALVRPDDLTRVNLAFFHVNAILSIGLFVVGTLDLLL
ncbi:MAG: 4-hydroxybenzoate octaprenyltransferase [Pirellulales bacterium]